MKYDRVGVTIASALGLATSSYFELEVRGVVPNPLAPYSPLLASVFSERAQEHVSILGEPWARALAFALALVVSLAALRGVRRGFSQPLRFAYALGTLVLPIATLLVSLVVHPFALGELCAPCLLQSLFALAIVECRSQVPAPLSAARDAPADRGAAWRNRYSSPPSA